MSNDSDANHPALQNLNPELCFVCQERRVTHNLTSSKGTFGVCVICGQLSVRENDTRNRIKQALSQGQAGQMLTMTLGMSLLPNRIKLEKI